MKRQEDFVHPSPVCDAEHVGPGEPVAGFSLIHPGARIGPGCVISLGVFLGERVELGSRVRVGQGATVDGDVQVEDDVAIGAGVVFSAGDEYPDLSQTIDVSQTVLRSGCRVGAGSIILPGVHIGVQAFVKPGSVVFDHVPDFAEVAGNPSVVLGYRHTGLIPGKNKPSVSSERELQELSVPGANLVKLKAARDGRGSLVAGQSLEEVPFDVRRFFLVFGVPNSESRGAHAHRECHQFLVVVSGSVNVVISDGSASDEVVLDNPSIGLYMPPMTWGIQYKYTSAASLLVLASHEYDPDDYIRDYSCFLAEKLAGDT